MENEPVPSEQPRTKFKPPLWTTALALLIVLGFPTAAYLRGMIAPGGIAGSFIGMAVLVGACYLVAWLTHVIVRRKPVVARAMFGSLISVLAVLMVLNLTVFSGNWINARNAAQRLQGAGGGGGAPVGGRQLDNPAEQAGYDAAHAVRMSYEQFLQEKDRVEGSRPGLKGAEWAIANQHARALNQLFPKIRDMREARESLANLDWPDAAKIMGSSRPLDRLNRLRRALSKYSDASTTLSEWYDTPESFTRFLPVVSEGGVSDSFAKGWATGVSESPLGNGLDVTNDYARASFALLEFLREQRENIRVERGEVVIDDEAQRAEFERLKQQVDAMQPLMSTTFPN